MKIVSKSEFMKLPSGTIYSDYYPVIFDGLKIKEESISYKDFYYENLIGNIKEDTFEFVDLKSSELEFNVIQRDGLFDDDKLYAIYDLNDMIGLRDRISECIDKAISK